MTLMTSCSFASKAFRDIRPLISLLASEKRISTWAVLSAATHAVSDIIRHVCNIDRDIDLPTINEDTSQNHSVLGSVLTYLGAGAFKHSSDALLLGAEISSGSLAVTDDGNLVSLFLERLWPIILQVVDSIVDAREPQASFLGDISACLDDELEYLHTSLIGSSRVNGQNEHVTPPKSPNTSHEKVSRSHTTEALDIEPEKITRRKLNQTGQLRKLQSLLADVKKGIR